MKVKEDALQAIIEELILWKSKGNTLTKLFKIHPDSKGALTVEIPKYDNSGTHQLKGFSSYKEALGFFGDVLDKV